MARRAVLLELDPELLARLDAWWRDVGYPSRRAGIRGAIEQALAAHAAHVASERRAVAEPNPWLPAGPVHTPDGAGEWRPHTAALVDDF